MSLLNEDAKNVQFQKKENNEIHKNDELFIKSGRNDRNFKNKIEQLKPKENNIIPIIKNKNNNMSKSKKINNRVNSSEIIKYNNIKEMIKNISVYNINPRNQELLKDKDKNY